MSIFILQKVSQWLYGYTKLIFISVFIRFRGVVSVKTETEVTAIKM